jgi:hypothetical protein
VSHPLIALANDRDVRRAASFRAKAAQLGGEGLRAAFEEEKANAPRLHDAGRRYLVTRGGKPASERRRNRDEEHLGAALVRHCRETDAGLVLPGDEGELLPIDYKVRVKPGPADDPATKGIERVDLLALAAGDRLTIAELRFAEPGATRIGVGDTPLRALLQGLAYVAIAEACRSDVSDEIDERVGRKASDEPPLLILLASPRYWELSRKREAQKGAAWIKEMERLAREIEVEVGVGVRYLSLHVEGEPGWTYDEKGPLLTGAPRLGPAWEYGAGRVKPRARPRPRPSAPVEVIVEPDLSRPVVPYAVTGQFAAGDRISHPVLGEGVVQGIAGPGKIRVRFEGRQSVLVHERPA